MYLFSLNAATYAVESFEPIAKWLTIGIVIALLIAGVALYFAKRSVFPTFVKYAVFGLFCYLLIVGIAFLALEIAKHYSTEYTDENWLNKASLVKYILVPLLTLAVLTLISLFAYALTSKFAPQAKKVVGYVGIAVFAVTLIASLVCIAIYYGKNIAEDGYYNSDTSSVKQIALYLSVVLIVLVVVGGTFFDKRKLTFDTRSLAYAGVCVAMSFALSYIKLWEMPQGGSVTLASLLPLMIYSYIFGTKKGVFAGFIYGILQALQDPWLIHPAQFLLDYPVAFAAIGLAGSFAKLPALEKLPQVKFVIGGAIASVIRYISHVLSGVFAFSAYAENQNPWAYSLAYNSFVFVDIAIVLIVGALIFSSKSFITSINKITPDSTNPNPQ